MTVEEQEVMNENRNILLDLYNLEEDLYEIRTSFFKLFTFNNGWVSVEKSIEDGIKVATLTKTSGKYHDDSFSGNAYILDIREDGTLSDFYETHLTLWLKWSISGSHSDINELKRAMEVAKYFHKVLIKSK